jgi:hypothetical protein
MTIVAKLAVPVICPHTECGLVMEVLGEGEFQYLECVNPEHNQKYEVPQVKLKVVSWR